MPSGLVGRFAESAKAVVAKIAGRYGGRGAAAAVDADTTATGFISIRNRSVPTMLSDIWQVSAGRRQILIDIEQMDADDGIVAEAIDVWADQATSADCDFGWPFYIDTPHKQLRNKIFSVIDSSGIADLAWQIIRCAIKCGEAFVEPVYNLDLDLVRTKLLPPTQIYRRQKPTGDLDDPPYIQRDAWDSGSELRDTDIRFRPWQIIHFRIPPYWPTGHAIPKLASERANWKRLQAIEDSMAIARLTRAYQKLLHKVLVRAGASDQQIVKAVNEYKKSMTSIPLLSWRSGDVPMWERMDNPLSVETDFFVPTDGQRSGAIESIDPQNMQLANLADVKYFQSKLFGRLGVPKALMGVEGDINASRTLEFQMKHFAKRIRRVQRILASGMMDMISLALFLKGTVPAPDSWAIRFPPVDLLETESSAKMQFTLGQAAIYWNQLGIPKELWAGKLLRMTDEEIAAIGEPITNDLATVSAQNSPDRKGSTETSAEEYAGYLQGFQDDMETLKEIHDMV